MIAAMRTFAAVACAALLLGASAPAAAQTQMPCGARVAGGPATPTIESLIAGFGGNGIQPVWKPADGATYTSFCVRFRVASPQSAWNHVNGIDVSNKKFNKDKNEYRSGVILHTSATPSATQSYPGVDYEFQVAGVNAAGRGRFSTTGDLTITAGGTAATAPGAPSDLTLTPGAALLTLTWAAPSGDVTGYAVRYAESGTSWINPAGAAGLATNSAATTYTIPSLKPGQAYNVQVAAVNSGNIGAWTASASGTPALGVIVFDVDESETADGTDGVLIARYLLGLRGADLIAGLEADLHADATAVSIAAAMGVAGDKLDVDGVGGVTAADGIMIARYLLGVTEGAALTEGQSATAHATVARNIAATLPQ